MKKKIKDLNKEDINSICERHNNCFECPLCLFNSKEICVKEVMKKMCKEVEE